MQRLLAWLSVCAVTALNEYESDGTNYWASLSPFVPRRNETYGTIQVKPNMFIQSDLSWHGVVEDGTEQESIFRIGSSSLHSHRYPALYVHRPTQTLQVAISDSEDSMGGHYEDINFTLTQNTTYQLMLKYTDHTVVILVDGAPMYYGERPGATPNDTLWSFVDVIISDARHTAANCTLDHMLILSYLTLKTMYPSLAPTLDTQSPSTGPTLEPTLHPTLLVCVSQCQKC